MHDEPGEEPTQTTQRDALELLDEFDDAHAERHWDEEQRLELLRERLTLEVALDVRDNLDSLFNVIEWGARTIASAIEELGAPTEDAVAP